MLGAASFDGMDLRRDTGQTQARDCSLVKSGRPRFVKDQLLVSENWMPDFISDRRIIRKWLCGFDYWIFHWNIGSRWQFW